MAGAVAERMAETLLYDESLGRSRSDGPTHRLTLPPEDAPTWPPPDTPT